MDTLPSGLSNPTVGASPWLSPPFPASCPFRVLHARAPRPARRYPRFRIWRPSSERQRDSNPPDLCAARHTPTDPSATLTPPLHFPVSSVIGTVSLQGFRPGTWRASPVASRVLVTVPPPNTPPEWTRASARLRQPMLPSCLLRSLGLRISSISGPHYVHLRCGPVTRSPLQRAALSMSFKCLVSRTPVIQATGVWLLPRQALLSC
jgi:hypothetical protein